MMKLAIALLLMASWSPYLFLATSVEEATMTDRAYNCTVTDLGEVDLPVSLGVVYYNFISENTWDNKRIVLPYFNRKGKVSGARCGDKDLLVGFTDYTKPGEKIHVFTDTQVIKFFGITLESYENINMFGTGWSGTIEGETIMIKLVDGKEVKMFGGKVIQ